MPANPLTPHELAEAQQLKKMFGMWQRARRDQGLPASQEDAAAMLGFGQSALSQYLNGKIPLNVDAAIKFSRLLGEPIQKFSPTLSTQVADYGFALTEVHNEDSLESGQRLVVRAGNEPDSVPIKRVQLRLSAGVTGFETVTELEDGGVLHVPRSIIDRNNLVPHCLLAVRVKGCSMEPMMFEDDWVVVNIADTKLVSREVYALNFDGEALVKQLVYRGKDWYMHSLNPDFGPINVRSGHTIVVGKVVWQPGRMLSGRL